MTTGLIELDEATLVARARDRDPAAFELLVRRYQRRIYTLCLRMLNGATGDAEDVAQETFVTAWRRLPEIQHDAAFGSWLYRTATNKCLTILQRRKPTTELDEESAPHDLSGDADPARAVGNSEAMQALAVALKRLPPPQRACWLLREVHGRSYQEIADLVGTTPTAVRGRIARARAELAEVMKPWR
ncbi:sigma-70 family RNA polymerase sigma factor [Kribbella antibiotica]|uniref:Sigma-70 family RNA polymerase sigma factor n=1 Tax=Kribbella antibiotica TaxID=190195 RepID=A0A4R4Z0T5_9ACTN|nr:sigma-70 family RNA polymerase sigma factor [Kribbella antibiotica]TDD51511.1 sigma-70 family RNA polymerase sigma factor [Kribbella antibiotica]